MIRQVIKNLMAEQFMALYRKIKGECPEELKQALKDAGIAELQEVLSCMPAIMQAEMTAQVLEDYEKQKNERPAFMDIKKRFLN
jgi:hypothetical protein